MFSAAGDGQGQLDGGAATLNDPIAPERQPSVPAAAGEWQQCLALLSQTSGPLLSQAVSSLCHPSPRSDTASADVSLMLVVYREQHGRIEDLVVQTFANPPNDSPGLLDAGGIARESDRQRRARLRRRRHARRGRVSQL